MATMSDYKTEAYVDNADGVYLFQLDGERVRWAARYEGLDGADLAAMDFCGLTVQDIDPIADGWDLGGYDSLRQAQDEYDRWFSGAEYQYFVASSDWYEGREADMLEREHPEDWRSATASRFTKSFLGL